MLSISIWSDNLEFIDNISCNLLWDLVGDFSLVLIWCLWNLGCIIKLNIWNQLLDFLKFIFSSVGLTFNEQIWVFIVLVYSEHLGGCFDQIVLINLMAWALLEQTLMQFPLVFVHFITIFLILRRFLLICIFKNILDYELGKWVNLWENWSDQATICIKFGRTIFILRWDRLLVKLIDFVQLDFMSLLRDNFEVLENFIQITLSGWLIILFHKQLFLLFVSFQLLLHFLVEINNGLWLLLNFVIFILF